MSEQVEKRIDAPAGLPAQGITLVRLAGHLRGVVKGTSCSLDAQLGLVAYRYQQRRLTCRQ
ncbi:hypothetical protein D3C73_1607900 [compost metagenome]